MMDDQSIPSCKSSSLVSDLQILTGSYISERAHVFGVVGAAIIIHNNRVLLLQRACDDEHPDLWEVPGGEAHKDETIVQCVIRELREEAGLHASEVVDMVGEFEWNEDRFEQAQHEQRIWKIFMFLVNVGDDASELNIQLDPREHQAYLWATESEVREGICGDIKLEWMSTNQQKAILAAMKK